MNIAKYEISVGAWIRYKGLYLIIKRSKSEKYGRGKWCIPGGKVEKGEGIIDVPIKRNQRRNAA